ncbi:MAG: antA/AntB antirepressor family protein [Flavobacteriaceae bacterium]|jgi:phage anti-repressor protein|nr:antA/AntB antirepressor family protein [Flavobacteriaceae bacterium]
MENELIKITEQNGKQAVNARELHAFLGSKRDFSNWIKDRIKKYGFIENQDFAVFDNFGENPTGGRPQKEYALTLDMAKELSMVENNDKGKIARQYFIQKDKEYRQISKPLSTLDMLELAIKGMRENNQELQEVKKDVLELKAKVTTRPDEYTIAGYATLNGMHVNLIQASKLGRAAKALCNNKNITLGKVRDPRFGAVYTYPEFILKEVFAKPVN